MKRLIFCLVLLIPALACGGPSHDAVRTELDAYFSGRFADGEPGGAVLVKRGATVIFEKGYGVADVGTGEKITPNTVFNTGSISKTFVANGILILYERGKLALDSSIDAYFPEFKNPDIARRITIEHLLSHTSGLIDSRDVSGRREFFLTADDAQNFYPVTQNDSLAFPPGSRFQYSNPAYNGLALIIEQVSGDDWRNFIRENIFSPAGMRDSKITNGAYPDEGVAHGYIEEDGTFRENDYGEVPTFCAAGNGGVWSSVRDLARYERALEGALFLDADLIEQSRTVFAPDNWSSDEPPSIGYSWFIGERNGMKTVSHTGSQGGFRADYVSIPEKRLLYVCLCNTPKDTGAFRAKVLEVFEKHGLLK